MNKLASEIYLKEHSKSYTNEQPERLKATHKYFNSFLFTIKYPTVYTFVKDYNNFLWKSINKSNNGCEQKIKANLVKGSTENCEQVDGFIQSLNYQNCDKKKFLASVLAAAYKNPKKEIRENLI